jgi:hypothetical protein
MATTTRQDFINYCYRALGSPVVQVNIDSQQAEDRLDESLEYMYERHFDFNQRALYAHAVTANDLATRSFDTTTFGPALGAQIKTNENGVTGYWPDATSIRSITKVYAPSTSVGDYMFDLRYQLTLFDFFGLYMNQSSFSAAPIASYMEGMSYIKLINDIFNYPVSYTYTKTSDRLYLETDYSKIPVGSVLMVEAYVAIDSTRYPKIWSDRIFKKHYTALLKKQWAQNLLKFSGVPLPGGASLNAPAMMQEAQQELNAIEETLKKTQELPPDPMIG